MYLFSLFFFIDQTINNMERVIMEPKEFLFHGWMMGKALNTAKEALQLGEVILGHQRLINWVRINISA